LLVAMHNYTDKLIGLAQTASGQPGVGFEPPGLGKGEHTLNLKIPDNSDSSKYFNTNNIFVQISDPVTKTPIKTFSFWDDDWKNYDILFCDGLDWKNTTRPMRGGNLGKDGTKIILHISERPNAMLPDTINLPDELEKYELTAVPVTDDQLMKKVVEEFQTFQ